MSKVILDYDKCDGADCAECADVCPKKLIDLIPESALSKSVVECSSQAKGKEVKDACEVGCIGCGVCKKQCEAGAIEIVNNQITF